MRSSPPPPLLDLRPLLVLQHLRSPHPNHHSQCRSPRRRQPCPLWLPPLPGGSESPLMVTCATTRHGPRRHELPRRSCPALGVRPLRYNGPCRTLSHSAFPEPGSGREQRVMVRLCFSSRCWKPSGARSLLTGGGLYEAAMPLVAGSTHGSHASGEGVSVFHGDDGRCHVIIRAGAALVVTTQRHPRSVGILLERGLGGGTHVPLLCMRSERTPGSLPATSGCSAILTSGTRMSRVRMSDVCGMYQRRAGVSDREAKRWLCVRVECAGGVCRSGRFAVGGPSAVVNRSRITYSRTTESDAGAWRICDSEYM